MKVIVKRYLVAVGPNEVTLNANSSEVVYYISTYVVDVGPNIPYIMAHVKTPPQEKRMLHPEILKSSIQKELQTIIMSKVAALLFGAESVFLIKDENW